MSASADHLQPSDPPTNLRGILAAMGISLAMWVFILMAAAGFLLKVLG